MSKPICRGISVDNVLHHGGAYPQCPLTPMKIAAVSALSGNLV